MTESATHVPLPTLCAECHREAVERFAPATWNIQWCVHNSTLAIGHCDLERIRTWDLQGPLTDAERLAIIGKLMAAAVATGLDIRIPTMQ